jgi:hypothetical protein
MFDDLTEENVLLYAVKCYEKPNCIMDEFNEDYRRIRYVKRLLQRYRKNKEIKERLVLNHLVILQNVFGPEASTRLLFYHINDRDHGPLKTFLLFLSSMPDVIRGIRGQDLISNDIQVDLDIAKILRKI